MKRAASPALMEVMTAESIDPSETEVITEIVTEMPDEKRQRLDTEEEEVCLDDGLVFCLFCMEVIRFRTSYFRTLLTFMSNCFFFHLLCNIITARLFLYPFFFARIKIV